MKISGNTILITGGGSGIGRGLAEAFQRAGNHVIIAGRRRQALDEVTSANPGMKGVSLDIDNPADIRDFGTRMAREFPALNVVVHNAGIMRPENLQKPGESLADAEGMVTTNLLGPIRLNAALLPLLRTQPTSTIMTVSSGLAFLPLSFTPTYCATKAAIHSYTLSLRWQLRETTTEVIELIPPYVQTELMGPSQAQDPRAMPLGDFLNEVMDILRTQPYVKEVCVERVKPLRLAEASGNFDAAFTTLNQSAPAPH
ncbi:MAG TPA: SDR family oxidoreductase [Tepidisphaeraceae bacterium]|nr:SDR family oxidoreductase [Tepidisphaeraceae bacterium]